MDLDRGVEDGERRDEGPSIGPYLRIQEEPVDEYRFRYEIEGRTNGSIPGINSMPPHRKTYPSVRVFGYKGPAVIRVSCVTKDPPYASHPHKLVGPSHLCDRGVASIHTIITDDNSTVEFRNLGIQCVKRCDVAQSMEERMSMRVDPFSVGFNPRTYPAFGLHSVRLAFQLLLPDARGLCVNPRRAVVSTPIADCKSKLRIMHASKCSSSVRGGEPITLLTEKLPRNDVTVVFEEEDTGWTAVGEVVFWHKGYGLIVVAPPYYDTEIEKDVKVVFYLKRLPNGIDTIADSRSNNYPFEYTAVPKQRAKSPKLPSALRSSAGLKRPRFEDIIRSSQHDTENIASHKVPNLTFQEIPPPDDTAEFEAYYANLNDQNPPPLGQRDYLTEAIQWNDNLLIPSLPPFLETENQVGRQYPEPHAEVYQQGLVADNHNVTADLQQYPTTSRQAQSLQVPTAIIKTKQLNQPQMTRSTMDENVAPATQNVPITQSYNQFSVGPVDYVGEMNYNNPFCLTGNILHPNKVQAACFRNNGPSTFHASTVNHESPMNYDSPINHKNQATSPSTVASLNHGSTMNYGSRISHTSLISTNYGSPMNYGSSMNQAPPMDHGSTMNYGSPINHASPIRQESSMNYGSTQSFGSSMNHAPPMEHGSIMNYGSPISQASPISQVSSTDYGSPHNFGSSMNHAPPMDHGSIMNYGSPISDASPISQESSTNYGSPHNYESSMKHAPKMYHGSTMNYGSPISDASPISQASSTDHEYSVNQPTLRNHGFLTNYVPLMNRTTFASSMNQRQMRREAAVLNELLNNAQSVDLPNSSELLESLVSLETYEDVVLVQDLSDGIDQLSTEDS